MDETLVRVERKKSLLPDSDMSFKFNIDGNKDNQMKVGTLSSRISMISYYSCIIDVYPIPPIYAKHAEETHAAL
jgi:hypothetical protein